MINLFASTILSTAACAGAHDAGTGQPAMPCFRQEKTVWMQAVEAGYDLGPCPPEQRRLLGAVVVCERGGHVHVDQHLGYQPDPAPHHHHETHVEPEPPVHFEPDPTFRPSPLRKNDPAYSEASLAPSHRSVMHHSTTQHASASSHVTRHHETVRHVHRTTHQPAHEPRGRVVTLNDGMLYGGLTGGVGRGAEFSGYRGGGTIILANGGNGGLRSAGQAAAALNAGGFINASASASASAMANVQVNISGGHGHGGGMKSGH